MDRMVAEQGSRRPKWARLPSRLRQSHQASRFHPHAHPLLILADPADPLSRRVAELLGQTPAELTLGHFPDDEAQVEIFTPVVGREVVLLARLKPDAAIFQTLLLVDAAKRSGARRVTLAAPYYPYARQDRCTGQQPLSAALVARLLEIAGVDALITLDLHNPALVGCFTIPVRHLSAGRVFVDAWAAAGLDPAGFVVGGPDLSASRRALGLVEMLGGADLVTLNKQRIDPQHTRVVGYAGEVRGRRVMLVDDIAASGETLLQAGRLMLETGRAAAVYASVTHLVCPQNLPRLLAEQGPFERLFVSDSLPLPDPLPERLSVVSVADLFARAIVEFSA